MTKSKRQLRAEAVERLKEVKPEDSAYQILNAIVDEYLCDYIDYDAANDAQRIIDLLTDDETCPNTDGTCPDAIGQASNAGDGNCGTVEDGTSQVPQFDSREKLEAEIRYEYNGSIEWEADQIIECLDRQAAITEMEMQAKVDALENENTRLRSRISDDAEYGRLVMDAYRELRAKLGAIREVVER